VFADDLEAVILGHADADERFIYDAANVLPVTGILALAEVDTNEWHGLISLRLVGKSLATRTWRRLRAYACTTHNSCIR
jgi:hypothetical protein